MTVHEWRDLTWPSFRALENLVAILPLGALEAHGPHLPLGTDIVIAEAMARAGAERLSRQGFNVAVLPALPVAPAPFASGFAGTVDAPAAATTAVVASIAASVQRHGGRTTVIANAHHDPAHVDAIRKAVVELEEREPGSIVFPDLTRRRWAARLTEEFQSGACHAGRYEGSVVLAERPDLVDEQFMTALAPNPRSLVSAIQRGDKTFVDAGGPEAYFGWPAEANAAEGRDIIDRLGAIVEEAVLEKLGELSTKDEGGRTERRTENGRTERRTENGMEQARAEIVAINPVALGRAVGFSHGMLTPAGWRALYVAGQTGAPGAEFSRQFDEALGRVVAVVREAGAEPAHIARVTIYVTSMQAYRDARPQLGDVWRRHMGRHYPAMALVEVTGLVDEGAVVEIQADAAVPPASAAVVAGGGR